MSIDVASLVFEIDSTQAVTARERLEGLEAAGAKVDATARRVKTATEQAGIGMEKIATGSARAAKAATEHAQAQGVVEKATEQAERAATRAAEREVAAWGRVETALGKRNAAYRGDLAAQSATAAAKAATQEAVAWGRVELALEKRNAALRGDLAAEQAMEAAKAAHAEAAAWGEVEAALERRNAEYRASAALESAKSEVAAIMAVEEAAEQEAIAWTKVEAALEKRNTALRGDLAVEQALAAARAADDEARAWAKVEASLERRNAELRESSLIATMKAEAAAVGALEGRIDRLMNSLDPTRAAQSRLNAEMQEASALYKMGAISASDYAKATSVLETRMDAAARGQTMLNGVMIRGAASSKHVTLAGLDLSRQFADIAVTGAMGMNPFMILIQQGPQIVDRLAQMKMEGIGLSAVLSGMGAAIVPFLPLLVAVGLVAGVAFGGAALAARELNKDNQDLVASLGLTEKQLERLKEKGVDTGVTIGDVFKGTFNWIAQSVGEALAPVAGWFAKLFDAIATGAVNVMKIYIGVHLGAFETIKATWKMLPAAMGDAAISAVNLTLTAMETMVNKAINLINGVIAGGNAIAAKVGLNISAPLLDHQSFAKVSNQYEGALSAMAEAGTAAFQKGMAKGGALVDQSFKNWGDAILGAAGDRLKKAAGDAGTGAKTPKGAATPRDQTDERTAQIEGMIQAALADELQARLGVTREIEARADIEKQIARAQEAVKSAQIAGRQATLDEDLQRKRINQATYDELSGQLQIVASINARAAAYREQAIEQNKVAVQSREELATQLAQRGLAIEILESEAGLARSSAQRRGIDLKILKHRQDMERLTLQQVTVANGALAIDELIAAARLAELNRIHGNERSSAYEAEDAFDDAADAMRTMTEAFKARDWKRLVEGFVATMDSFKLAFGPNGTFATKAGAVAGLAGMAGQAIGGKTGSAISGAAGGAMGGLALAQLGLVGGPFGAIAGAAVGGLLSMLGSDKAAKRAKAEREAQDIANARAVAQERANQQAEMELRVLELSGDEVGALAMRREAELAALNGANRALAEHIHKLEDWASAVAKATDAVSAAEDDLREAYEAEKDRLNGVIAGVDAARDRLRDAYQRERGAIEGTISSVRSLVETFADFRKELDMMAVANDPSRQYGYAQREFATATNDNFIERGRAFADASQSASATDLDFQRDLAAVRRRTDEASKTAQTQLTTAERQLLALDNLMNPLLGANDNMLSVDEAIRGLLTAEQEAALAVEELARLDAQVGALITINSSVLSVAQAVNNLQGALGALAAAQAAKPAAGAAGGGSQAVGLAGYIDRNADLAALYASGAGMAKGRTKEEFAAYHWERYGQGEGRAFTPFARGGAFTNGVVNQPTAFDMGVMGEAGPEAIMPLEMGPNGLGVRSRGGGDTAKLEALVEELTEKVVELTALQRNDNLELKRNTKDSAGMLAKVTQGSDTVRVKAA